MTMQGGSRGSLLLAQELFQRADPAFVEELRKVDDADGLGTFAGHWVADTRPEARAFLFDYLDRPLNAYRHEALVKRAFKFAEMAKDDALMARFLVAFDRPLRRVRSPVRSYRSQECRSQRDAEVLAELWRAEGMEDVKVWQNWKEQYQVWGFRTQDVMTTPPGTEMPRGKVVYAYDPSRGDTFQVPDWVVKLKLPPGQFRKNREIPENRRAAFKVWRLFSIRTRKYLRRRAWRYFRKLGRTHPERYIPAVSEALTLYRDGDAPNGLALIDNWSLVHILFHFSPVLTSDDHGWRVAPGRSLSELEPAPMFGKLWGAEPRAVVDVLIRARCRVVRTWSARMIRRHLAAYRPLFTLEQRLGLLADDDPEIVILAIDLLKDDPALKDVPVDRWVGLLRTASPSTLEILVDLISGLVDTQRVSLADAVAMALARPLPVSKLGLLWLQPRVPRDDEECRTVLGLAEAECEPVRPQLIRWARNAIANSGLLRPEWVVEWIDSRHLDVRSEGWAWFRSEPAARDDVTLWQRLMESPYDDIRLAIVSELESRTLGDAVPRIERGDLDPERLRLLWACVLLNIFRGNRAKPKIVRQLLRRIEARSDDLPRLLPLLVVALRSISGPEFRSGLSAVVRLADRDEAAARLVAETFPELVFT
jgi:hypothetical protein